MGDWGNAALQAAFWTYANSLRREAKLCDIILYVQGRKGAMVGYPAHKLLLISASKYFKLLFEREDLRNACHFPHLSEDGLFTVLDIVYGREIPDSTNLEDALMAARFLQVDCAVEVLEHKKTVLAESRSASSASKHRLHSDKDSSMPVAKVARTAESPSTQHVQPITASPSSSSSQRQNKSAEMRTHRTFKNQDQQQDTADSDQFYNQDSSYTEHSDNQDDSNMAQDSSTLDVKVKLEPDVDLTMDDGADDGNDDDDATGFSQIGFGHGNMGFAGHSFGSLENQTDPGMFQGQTDMVNPEMNFDPSNPQRVNAGKMRDFRKLAVSVTTHHQMKPYVCGVCGKRFPTMAMLKQHDAVHTGERRYACQPCGKTFTQSSGLWKHNQRHHSNQQPHNNQ